MSELNCTTLVTNRVLPLTNSENKISSITNNTSCNLGAYALHVNNINTDLLNVGNCYNENKQVYMCSSSGITVDCFVFDSGITTKDVNYLRNGTCNFNFKCNSDGTDLCFTSACGIRGTHFLVVSCGGSDYYLPAVRYQCNSTRVSIIGLGNPLFTEYGFCSICSACKFALCATNTSTNTMVSYTVKANSFNNKLTSLICNDSRVNHSCDKIKYYVTWATCSYCCARGHMIRVTMKPVEYVSCCLVENEYQKVCLKISQQGCCCNGVNCTGSSINTCSYIAHRGTNYKFLKDHTYTCICTRSYSYPKKDEAFSITVKRPTDFIFGRTDQCIGKGVRFIVCYQNPISTGSGWSLIDSGSAYICD